MKGACILITICILLMAMMGILITIEEYEIKEIQKHTFELENEKVSLERDAAAIALENEQLRNAYYKKFFVEYEE